MKKQIKYILVLTFTICKINMCYSQTSPERELKKIKFIGIKERDTTFTNQIKAVIIVDTIQKQSEKGLRFSIKLKNRSAQPDTILNILDVMRINLVNEQGSDVYYRYVPPQYFDPRNYVSKSFHIDKVEINHKADTINLFNAPNGIILPPKSEFEIFLSIHTVLKSKSELLPKPAKLDDYFMTIAKGIYKMQIYLSIIKKPNVPTDYSALTVSSLSLSPTNIKYGK